MNHQIFEKLKLKMSKSRLIVFIIGCLKEYVFFLSPEIAIISSNKNMSSEPAFMCAHIIHIQEVRSYKSKLFPLIFFLTFSVFHLQSFSSKTECNSVKKSSNNDLLQLNCHFWLKLGSRKRPCTSHSDIFAWGFEL